MNSTRKRNLSRSLSISPVKKCKEDPDSDDSFENFGKIVSPKVRSKKIELEEDDDSFDTPPVINIVKKKESGIPGFPWIGKENTLRLEVVKVENIDESLHVECRSGNLVYLQDQWSESKIDAGDILHLLNPKKWADNDYIIDSEQGLLIVNPDVLVPCTSTASATWCARKQILNDRFKFGNSSNKAMLLGTIIHEIFQTAISMKKRPIKEEDLLDIWKKEAKNYVQELIALSFTPNCFNAEIQPYLGIICDWINKKLPKTSSFFEKAEPLPSKSIISEVHDIEDNIWEPILGLKGKVDVTIKTKTGKMESLELKTGKSSGSVEHMGQVLLYCMMLSSKYDQQIGSGNLLYLKDGESRSITPRAQELFAILQQRNNLAKYFDNSFQNLLPEPRVESRFCDKCDQKLMCTYYQKNEEKFEKTRNVKMREFAEKEMEHLEKPHVEYVSNWIRWILAEWKSEYDRNDSKPRDLWLKSVKERQNNGTCYSTLYLELCENNKIIFTPRIEISTTKTRKAEFRRGDVCVLSSDKQMAIGIAVITKIHENTGKVEVSFDKSLKSPGPYYLDKYTSSSNFSTILGNLTYFIENDEIGGRLRSVLVDLVAPRIPKIEELPMNVRRIIGKAKLNNEQRLAVINALVMEDYLIVEGLPGSGKTTLISVLIQCLIATGKSVLLAAFTHSAVDNILTKLTKEVNDEKILRLGNLSAVKEDIHKLALASKIEKVDNEYGEVKKILKNTPVVACTCHHVPRELLFSYRNFDVVIVDEASMVLEPLILPVLATSSKFVLVGDCKQLTPLVLSKKAKNEGADVSTMQKLQKEHPKIVVSLTSQYRMNSEISKLSSKLFYENRLICGNEMVSRSCLEKSDEYSLKSPMDEDFLKRALSPKLEDSVVFIDTNSETNDSMKCEDFENGGCLNREEAIIVEKLYTCLIENGVKPEEIGIMSAYRRQVDYIQQQLNRPIEVNTIDSYQGREKRVIIWTITWTNNSSKKSELLRDERRVNVALTRGKQKLIIIGCRKSCDQIPILYRLNDLMNKENIMGI